MKNIFTLSDGTKKAAKTVILFVGAFMLLAMAVGGWKIFITVMLLSAGLVYLASAVKPRAKFAWWIITWTVIALLYGSVLYPQFDQYMLTHWPGSWRTIQTVFVHWDIDFAQSNMVAGNDVKAIQLNHAVIFDDLNRDNFDLATKSLVEKRQRGELWTHEDSLQYYYMQVASQRDNQNNQALMAGGLLMSPASTNGSQSYGNHILLEVDVKNPDGATFDIPAGATVEISVDSAWYNCNFAEMDRRENRYCDADGYGIAPKKTRGGAAFTNRFLNPFVSMGAVLIFDERNPQGVPLAMGQTVTVKGDDVTIAVNDWRGGIFGGDVENFTASKQLRRGGFFDNRGYLRVLIVVNP